MNLPEQALDYMGERLSSNQKVFGLSDYQGSITKNLQRWCEDACIDKQITYHSSRHTFAVLQLSLGTPIYTVQKLLGHTNSVSTMVYADIVDSEKKRAMNIIPNSV